MIGFKAEIYTQKAVARLGKIEKKIEAQGQATVQDLVNAGKEWARMLVPKHTGWLYKTIKGRVEPTTKGTSGKIFLEPNIVPIDGVHRRSPGRYPNFDLARWMHTSPRANSRIKTGSPQFMYSTRDYLNRIKRNVAAGRFKNINIK